MMAAEDFHYYEPAKAHGLPHDPFNAMVGPRPIGAGYPRGTRKGSSTSAPYSFFNAFNYTPPIIGFASIGAKDSLRNIRETGEFGWNLGDTAAGRGHEPLPRNGAFRSHRVRAGRPHTGGFAAHRRARAYWKARCPSSCRLTQLLQLQGADGVPVPTGLVLGEVVGVYIARHLLKDGIYDTAAAQPILRGGGPADYFTFTPDNLFRMFRPR